MPYHPRATGPVLDRISGRYAHRRNGFNDDMLRAELERTEAEDRAAMLLEEATRAASGHLSPRDLADWVSARTPGLPDGSRAGLRMGGIAPLFGWLIGRG